MPRSDDPSTAVTYAVYLREGETAGPDVTSPVETSHIDFYDTGIWVTRDDGGRDFFPWERVDMIREQVVTESTATEAEGELESVGAEPSKTEMETATEEEQGPIV